MNWVVLLSALEPPVCLVQTQGWLQLLFFATVSHLSELIQMLYLVGTCRFVARRGKGDRFTRGIRR